MALGFSQQTGAKRTNVMLRCKNVQEAKISFLIHDKDLDRLFAGTRSEKPMPDAIAQRSRHRSMNFGTAYRFKSPFYRLYKCARLRGTLAYRTNKHTVALVSCFS